MAPPLNHNLASLRDLARGGAPAARPPARPPITRRAISEENSALDDILGKDMTQPKARGRAGAVVEQQRQRQPQRREPSMLEAADDPEAAAFAQLRESILAQREALDSQLEALDFLMGLDPAEAPRTARSAPRAAPSPAAPVQPEGMVAQYRANAGTVQGADVLDAVNEPSLLGDRQEDGDDDFDGGDA